MAAETRLSLLARIQDPTAEESWREFFEMYQRWIESWLGRQGVPATDREDISQDVMVVVMREIGQFEHSGRPGAFRAWLRTVTSNRLRNHWRKEKGRPRSTDFASLADQLADEQSQQSALWNAEHNEFILNYLIRMVSRQFSQQSVKVFQMIAIDQIAPEKVASDLGMTLGAVHVARHRVLAALKEAGDGLIEF